MCKDKQEAALFKLCGVAHDLFFEASMHELPLCTPPNLFNGGNAVEQAQISMTSSDSDGKAASGTDTSITVVDIKSECQSGAKACDSSTQLAGSTKADMHEQKRGKRGRKGFSDHISGIQGVLEGALGLLAKQRAEQVKRDSEECTADCQVFLEAIKLICSNCNNA